MAKDRKEPTQTTDKGLEIPVPTRAAWDDTLAKVIKPVSSLVEDARHQEADSADDGDAADDG